MIFSISRPSSGDPRSSASTTRIHSFDERSIATLRWSPMVSKGFETTTAPAASARATVSSIDPSSTTSISRAHETLSMHAAMFADSFFAAITTVTSTLKSGLLAMAFSVSL